MPTTKTKTKTTKATKAVPLATSKGIDKYGFSNSGKRAYAATLYGAKGGATTAAVKAATLKKYGKGYPMLNMLRKLQSTSKAWQVVTTQVVSNSTGRNNTAYAIVARKDK